MLNLTDHKYSPGTSILTLFDVLDKGMSVLLKLTFPFWAIPFLTILMILKLANFWKHLGQLIESIMHPNLPPTLAYAILKGNGQYLRDQHEAVLTRQFYDYTSRKFMSIAQLDTDWRVYEVQCDNNIGIGYIAENLKPGNGMGLISDQKLLNNTTWPQKNIKVQDYSIKGQSLQIDCFLLFNFKSKINYLGSSKVDLLKILKYCSYHLQKQGYIVFGDYFEKGELDTFHQIFGAYNFYITDEEDITKNIDYAKKLITKDRNQYEVQIFNVINGWISNLIQKKPFQQDKSFYVLILQKRQTKK